MAEDEETATARYVAANISTQLMLKTIIEIISTMADDPDKYRAEDKVRAFVRETISTLLTNKPPN